MSDVLRESVTERRLHERLWGSGSPCTSKTKRASAAKAGSMQTQTERVTKYNTSTFRTNAAQPYRQYTHTKVCGKSVSLRLFIWLHAHELIMISHVCL